MRKSNFGRYFSLLMIAFSLVSGTSVYAQKHEITRYERENNYFLDFTGLGLRMLADGPETVVTNGIGQSAKIGELATLGDKFEITLPLTIKNAKCENILVEVFDKSETSREEIVKEFTKYMFEGNIIRKNERVMNVEFRLDHESYLTSSIISFGTHQKDSLHDDRYVVKTLYDIHIIPAYAIVETRQNPSATIAAVDSVVVRNQFEKALLKADQLMTKQQADSIGDGFDLFPVFLPEVAALFEKHDMKRIPSVEDGLLSLAVMYNDAVGHFPPTYAATHKELVAREEAKLSHRTVERFNVPTSREQRNVPTAPANNFNANQKPRNSRVTVTTNPNPEFLGPQFDRNGRPVVINPMQNNQRRVGSGVSINFNW